MLLQLLCAAVALAAPPQRGLVFYTQNFDKGAPEIRGTASVVPGRDGNALRLASDGSTRVPSRMFAHEAGRLDLDLALYAPIVPRDDNRHAMLMTDVGGNAAWRGATVLYWDAKTAVLSWGVFDGGWRWLKADRAKWESGAWHHLALEWGTTGRVMEIDGTTVARDDYGRGIDPQDMRFGQFDSFTDAAPVLIDNLRLTAFPQDALRVSSAVVCPNGGGVLDSVKITWSVSNYSLASLTLRAADGSVAQRLFERAPVVGGWYANWFAARGVPSGKYMLELLVEQPGRPAITVSAPLSVDASLRWQPAPNRMGDRFPLGAWYFWEEDASYIQQHVDDTARATAYYDRTMADLHALGVDTVMADWTPRDHRRIMLDAAQRHGVRAIVHLDEVNAFVWDPSRFTSADCVGAFRDAVVTVRDHPATLGYYLVDEPSPTPENRQSISIAKKVVEALDPAHPGFSCLLGDYAELYRQVGYHVLLVDIYPVYNARLQGATLDGYVAAVDRARQVAAGQPMWVIPQCFGFGKPQPHGIPAPNEVSLMVWEAVAHGAKGIIYFIYQSTTSIQGEWLQGVVDMNLKPMDHRYEEVRRTNAAVRAVSRTLLGLTWTGSARELVTNPSIDAQTFRDRRGARYICLVNRDTQAGVSASVALGAGERLVDSCTGKVLDPARVGLAAGGGRLARIVAR